MSVRFTDNSIQVKNLIDEVAITYLNEAAGEVVSQTQRNTKSSTGQLKGSWTYEVDESKKSATIGSPLENAIWAEFGTGEYALNGDGRKTPWVYKDEKGNWYNTTGKPPTRAFWNAYTALKSALIKRAESVMKGIK